MSTFAGAALGAWDIVVTDVASGATATLPGAFTVTLNPTTTVAASISATTYKTTAQSLTVSATVSSLSGVPTGTVTFQFFNGATPSRLGGDLGFSRQRRDGQCDLNHSRRAGARNLHAFGTRTMVRALLPRATIVQNNSA